MKGTDSKYKSCSASGKLLDATAIQNGSRCACCGINNVSKMSESDVVGSRSSMGLAVLAEVCFPVSSSAQRKQNVTQQQLWLCATGHLLAVYQVVCMCVSFVCACAEAHPCVPKPDGGL